MTVLNVVFERQSECRFPIYLFLSALTKENEETVLLVEENRRDLQRLQVRGNRGKHGGDRVNGIV